MNFKDRLLPVRVGSGFRMEGYFIWCGSMIRGDDGRCYLFAARFPKNSEITLTGGETGTWCKN